MRSEGKTGRFDAVVPPGFILVVAAGIWRLMPGLNKAAPPWACVWLLSRTGALPVSGQIGDTQGQFGRFMARRGIAGNADPPPVILFGGAKDPVGLTALLAVFARQRAALNFNAKQSVAVPA